MIDFSSLSGLATSAILLFIILVLLYLLFACLLHWMFYIRKPSKFETRKIYSRDYSGKQLRKELKWSLSSSLIFSLSGSLLGYLWQEGYTMIYLDVDDMGWFYLPISLVFILVLHETYYYWIHRWLHQPGLFRRVHKVHHESQVTSPWTTFSFHPLEAFLQAVFLPLVLMIVPVHPVMLVILLLIMIISGFINHLGYEIFPEKFNKHFAGKWLNSATHHARHHRQNQFNFGLYFTFWDKWKRTEFPAKLRVVRKNTVVAVEKDNRAKLFIVKPRAVK